MFKFPDDVNVTKWIGQQLYSFTVQEHMLRLDFGRADSLGDGQYRDFLSVEVEQGLQCTVGQRKERFMQDAQPRRLSEAAEVLGCLVSQKIVAAEVLQGGDLALIFGNRVRIVFLVGELESYHIHDRDGSFSV